MEDGGTGVLRMLIAKKATESIQSMSNSRLVERAQRSGPTPQRCVMGGQMRATA